MPPVLALSLAVILVAASAPPPADDPIEAAPPSPAIVGGHHIQPSASGSGSDLAPGDAADIDRLYQELMRQRALDTQGGGDDHLDRLYQQQRRAPAAGNPKPP